MKQIKLTEKELNMTPQQWKKKLGYQCVGMFMVGIFVGVAGVLAIVAAAL